MCSSPDHHNHYRILASQDPKYWVNIPRCQYRYDVNTDPTIRSRRT